MPVDEFLPVHWDMYRNIHGYMAKWSAFLLFSIIPFFLLVTKYGIKYLKEDNFENRVKMKLLKLTNVSSLTLGWIIFLRLNALNFDPINLFLGIMFISIAFILPSLPQSKYFGIKTPWTLKSSSNWHKTHYAAKYYWSTAGFLFILSSTVANNIVLTFSILALLSAPNCSFVLSIKKRIE